MKRILYFRVSWLKYRPRHSHTHLRYAWRWNINISWEFRQVSLFSLPTRGTTWTRQTLAYNWILCILEQGTFKTSSFWNLNWVPILGRRPRTFEMAKFFSSSDCCRVCSVNPGLLVEPQLGCAQCDSHVNKRTKLLLSMAGLGNIFPKIPYLSSDQLYCFLLGSLTASFSGHESYDLSWESARHKSLGARVLRCMAKQIGTISKSLVDYY